MSEEVGPETPEPSKAERFVVLLILIAATLSLIYIFNSPTKGDQSVKPMINTCVVK